MIQLILPLLQVGVPKLCWGSVPADIIRWQKFQESVFLIPKNEYWTIEGRKNNEVEQEQFYLYCDFQRNISNGVQRRIQAALCQVLIWHFLSYNLKKKKKKNVYTSHIRRGGYEDNYVNGTYTVMYRSGSHECDPLISPPPLSAETLSPDRLGDWWDHTISEKDRNRIWVFS